MGCVTSPTWITAGTVPPEVVQRCDRVAVTTTGGHLCISLGWCVVVLTPFTGHGEADLDTALGVLLEACAVCYVMGTEGEPFWQAAQVLGEAVCLLSQGPGDGVCLSGAQPATIVHRSEWRRPGVWKKSQAARKPPRRKPA